MQFVGPIGIGEQTVVTDALKPVGSSFHRRSDQGCAYSSTPVGRAQEAFSGGLTLEKSIQRQGVTPPPSAWQTGGK
jgi:hypothetical protein